MYDYSRRSRRRKQLHVYNTLHNFNGNGYLFRNRRRYRLAQGAEARRREYSGSQYEYEEIVQDIKISKEIQIDTDSLVLEEGVSLDCDNDEESDISLLKIQTPNKPGKLSLKIGTEYVNAKIEADIPTYIVNWNINEASMIMNYSGQVSGNIEYNTKLDNSNEKYDKMYKLGKVWSIPINGRVKVEVDLYFYV